MILRSCVDYVCIIPYPLTSTIHTVIVLHSYNDIQNPSQCSSLLPAHPFFHRTPSTNPTLHPPLRPNINKSSLIDGRVLQRDLLIRDLEPPPQPPDHRLYKEGGEKKERKRVGEREREREHGESDPVLVYCRIRHVR